MTKKLSNTKKGQIKDLIIQIAKKDKPATTQQLITLIHERTTLSKEEITNLIIELENENKISFTKLEPPKPKSPKEYFFSTKDAWYWITIAFAIATATTVFTIPDTAYSIVYLRIALSVIFILFMPGFTLIKMLFPSKLSIKTSSENMNAVEYLALSIGLSLSLVPIIGLILNYTSWEIRLTPITLSLTGVTIVFATVAVLREYQAKSSSFSNQHAALKLKSD